MKIIYFAWLKEITNKEFECFNDPKIKNLNDLKIYLIKIYPKLKIHIEKDLLRIAINKEYCYDNISLNFDDEIAIFPPVSGG